MTVATADGLDRRNPAQLRRVVASVGPFRLAIATIVVAQALWLGVLASRGWYYQDDFTFLAQATGKSLNWSYLSSPVNSHLTPGLRLEFWIMQHFAPFNNGASILARVLLQTVAVILLARLLVLLVGPSRIVLVVLAAYAFSPLLLPGFLWYAASANLLPAQIFAILAIRSHIVYSVTGRLRYSLAAGVSLLLVAAFWEKSTTVALTLPILSLGFLHDGPIRQRLGATVRNWKGWVLTALPLVAFVAYFVARGYGSGGSLPGATTILRLSWLEWLRSIAPSMFGGPWSWFSGNHVYESFSATPVVLQAISQILFAGLVALGLRRCGRRSLLAWLLPAVTIIVGMALVSAGRYTLFGALLDNAYTYVFDSAVPIAIAVCLAMVPTSARAMSSRLERDPQPSEPTDRSSSRLRTLGVVASIACLVASSLVSEIVYSHRWAQNPSAHWVNALRDNVRALGPQVNLYNTGVPVSILPAISETRHVSDVLGILGLSARFDNGDTDPQIVTDSGQIVPATLLQVATAKTDGPNAFCNDLISGATTRTQPLRGRLTQNEWFLRLAYFQQRPSVLRISFLDAAGHEIKPVNGASTVLSGQAGQVYLQFPFVAPTAVRIRSDDSATNTCITSAVVGYPFAKSP